MKRSFTAIHTSQHSKEEPMHIYTRMALFLIGLAVLLSGCSLSIGTRINEDGSGKVVVMYIFPKDTYTCAQAQREGLIGKNIQWRQETTSRGNISCSASEDFNDLSQLRRSMESSGIVTVRDLTISNYVLTYDMDVYPRSQSTGIYTMYWNVFMPGVITEHNANDIDGNMLTWQMTVDQRNRVFARSQLPIPPTPTPGRSGNGVTGNNGFLMAILALGGFLVIGGLVGVVVIVQRQRAPRPPAYSPPPTTPPAGVYPAAPPTTPPTDASSASPAQKPVTVEERLQRLKELHERGLIDNEEFHARQRTILDDL